MLSDSTGTTTRFGNCVAITGPVPHYWLLDPETGNHVFREPQGYLSVLVADRHQVVRPEPFEVMEVRVGVLLGDDPVSPSPCPASSQGRARPFTRPSARAHSAQPAAFGRSQRWFRQQQRHTLCVGVLATASQRLTARAVAPRRTPPLALGAVDEAMWASTAAQTAPTSSQLWEVLKQVLPLPSGPIAPGPPWGPHRPAPPSPERSERPISRQEFQRRQPPCPDRQRWSNSGRPPPAPRSRAGG